VRIGPRNPPAQEIVTSRASYLEPHLGSCRRLLTCNKMLEENSITGFEAVWSAASVEHASGGGSCLLCTFPRCGRGAKRGLSTGLGSYVPTYPSGRYLLGQQQDAAGRSRATLGTAEQDSRRLRPTGVVLALGPPLQRITERVLSRTAR
jgi:hypothetical protein